MQTVIVRLSVPTGDGQLHGLVEVVGTGGSAPFTDDAQLLTLLREATGAEGQRNNRARRGAT